MNLVSLFKKSLKDRGLKGLIRAQRAGCLDSCEQGPSLVVYPDNAWYGGVQPHHVEQIIDDHLVNDQPVEKLLIDWGVEEEKST